jgi:hypothetical protein
VSFSSAAWTHICAAGSTSASSARWIALSATSAAGIGVGVVVDLGGMQCENCAQVLCARERYVGRVERDALECTTLRGNGVEKDRI